MKNKFISDTNNQSEVSMDYISRPEDVFWIRRETVALKNPSNFSCIDLTCVLIILYLDESEYSQR